MIPQKHRSTTILALFGFAFLMCFDVLDEGLLRILQAAFALYLLAILLMEVKESKENTREKKTTPYKPRPGTEKKFMTYLVGTMIGYIIIFTGVGKILDIDMGLWGIGLFIVTVAVFIHTVPRIAPMEKR